MERVWYVRAARAGDTLRGGVLHVRWGAGNRGFYFVNPLYGKVLRTTPWLRTVFFTASKVQVELRD